MSLTIFEQKIQLMTVPSAAKHNQRFLDIAGVEEIDHIFFRKAKIAEMRAATAALTARIRPRQLIENPIWIFFFNSGKNSGAAVSTRRTHAASVFSENSKSIKHQYFERRDELFTEVESLSMPVATIPDIDDIRMLHFAAFDIGQLPARSTIIEFKAEKWSMEHTLKQGPSELRLALLLDPDRIAGAPIIGLYGDAFYTALLGTNGGGGNCGNDGTCPPGGEGTCEAVPPSESAGYRCKTGDASTGDGWISAFNQAVKLRLVSKEDVDFGPVRTLLADFMPSYSGGKKFISNYYILSMFMRHDRRAIEEYVRALPHMRAGVYRMLHGRNNSIVVNTELHDALMRILTLNENVNVPTLQKLVLDLEQGLRTVTDRRRSEVIDLLARAEPN